MRRAAFSILANIAEGFRKRDKADKARFMNTAEGSIEECRITWSWLTTLAMAKR
jgi:four helix bundle protein